MATKNKPLTPDELVAAIKSEQSMADYSGTQELSFQREQSTRAYNGELTDGLQPTTGMSSITNNKVQAAVDTLTNHTARPFISDHDTVIFTSTLPEYSEAATQFSNIVNYVVHKQNDGSSIISEWLRDAAINKNGIVKVTWDDTPTSYKEVMTGSQKDIDIWIEEKEATGVECEIVEEEKETRTRDVEIPGSDEYLEVSTTEITATIKVTRPGGRAVIENVPPEEFFINEGSTKINGDPKTRFVAQTQAIPVGALMKEFPDADIDWESLPTASYAANDYEKQNRHSADGTFENWGQEATDFASRLVDVVECWIRFDMDGDGYAELRHAMVVGHELLMDEEWFGDIPFASFTFFPTTHKFYGLSVYDRIGDLHRGASMLLRSEIDFRLQQNTFRIIANPKELDLRDLMSGRPGIIKAKPGFDPSNVLPIPAPQGATNTVQLLEHIDRQIASRLGIDPITGVVSQDIQVSGNDAAKTSQVIDAASNNIEAYARRFADGALKDIVWQVARLILANIDDPGVARLVRKATEGADFLLSDEGMVEAIDRDDLQAKVGLGFQTMQQKLLGSKEIIAQQAMLEGSANAIPMPAKFKLAASEELARSMGYENTSRFFPSEEEVQAERQRIQQEAQKAKEAEMKMAQAQMEDQFASNESKRRLDVAKANEAEVKANAAARNQELLEESKVVDIENVKQDNALNERRQESQEEQMVANLERQRAREMLDRENAELKARTDIEIAHINANARVRDNANLKKDRT